MSRLSFVPFYLVLVILLAQSAVTSLAQTKRFDDIKLSSKLDLDINEMKKGEAAANRKTLDEFMSYFAEKLQHPDMFKAAQEFGTTVLPMESLLNQFSARVLVPEPGSRYRIEQADYINSFGQSFVATFKPILETHPDRIIRLNAARLLAAGAACGAPDFAPLIIDLIANPNTPTEVKYWAFKAAEALLAAYDIVKMNGTRPQEHTVSADILVKLLKLLEQNIYEPTRLVTFPQGVDPKQPPPELGAVVTYIRRQAVRAYARVRWAAIEAEGETYRPAWVLAKIALSDPALHPPPGPAELAEAVIGLCSMQPDQLIMEDAVADAVATGLISFAGYLFTPDAEAIVKTTPWKGYSMRLRQALTTWKTIVANASIPPNRHPQSVPLVADAAIEAVINPLEATGEAGKVGVRIERLRSVRDSIRQSKTYSKELYRGVASTSLESYLK